MAEHFKATHAGYHASPGVSNSMVSVARKNLELFRGRFVDKTIPNKTTKTMEFGDACHKMILGDGTITVIPPDVLAKNGAKSTNAYKAFALAHRDESLVTEKEHHQLEAMKAVLLSVPRVAAWLNDSEAHREYPIRWTDPETGMLLRTKPDILTASCIPDLKTAASCDHEAFAKQALNLGYHRQAVFYPMGVKAFTGKQLPFVFIVQEKTEPYTVELIELSQTFLARGLREIRETLDKIEEADIYLKSKDPRVRALAYRSPTWGDITTVDEPRWAKYDDEYELAQETEE